MKIRQNAHIQLHRRTWGKAQTHIKVNLFQNKFPNRPTFKNTFKGEMVNGKFHGQGKMTFPNGDVYTGKWFWGVRNGEGKLRKKKARQVYKGTWKNDWFVSGSISTLDEYKREVVRYTGQIKNSLYHGKGTLKFFDPTDGGSVLETRYVF